jgi:septal ring factor EnvC (AmiA/AmiB activator)
MDKDVSGIQDEQQASDEQLARARRRQSLLDRMMVARSKRNSEKAVLTGADEDAPKINLLMQPRAVPHAPLATEIKSAAGQAMLKAAEPKSNAGVSPVESGAESDSNDAALESGKAGFASPGEAAHEPNPDVKRHDIAEDDTTQHEAHDDDPQVDTLRPAVVINEAVPQSVVENPSSTRETFSDLQNQIYRLTANISTVEKRFSNAKKIHKDQYAQMRLQLDQLSEQVRAAQQAFTDMANQSNAATVDVQTQMQSQWQAQITQWEVQINELTEALAAQTQKAREQHEKILAQQADYVAMLNRLKAEKNDSEDLKKQLQNALEAATTQKNSLISDYEGLKADFQGGRANLDEEIARLKHLREEGQKILMLATAARQAASNYNGLTEERLKEIDKLASDVFETHQESEAQRAALAEHRDFVKQQQDEQKAMAAKVAEETAGLARLSETFLQTEREIQHLKSAMHGEVDRVEELSEQVAEQAEAVAQHVVRINDAVAQHAVLDDAVQKALQRLETALAAQQKGMEKFGQLEQRFDVAVASVAAIQSEWQSRDDQWQQRCSANDENYRNLVALLDRSRQNEAALEALLDSVKALEQRSNALVQTAQVQCDRQADMQSDLIEEQSRWNDMIVRADQSASDAKTAADQVREALERITGVEIESEKRQLAQAQANDAVLDEVDRAQAWMQDAVTKAEAWQDEAEYIAKRQAALAEQCQQLFEKASAQDQSATELREMAEALAATAQARLDRTEVIAQRAEEALTKVADTVKAACGQEDKLTTLARNTQQQINDMLAENRALADQSRALQHRVRDQSDHAEKAQSAIDSALVNLQTHQAQVDSALAEVTRVCDQWSAHESALARLESQSTEALQAAQSLQMGAQQMMNNAATDQQQIQTALNTVKKLSDEVVRASECEQRLRAQAEALVGQVQMQLDTQEQVASDQAATTLRTEVMHDQITALDQATQSRLSQLKDLHTQVAALLTENMSLQSDLKEVQQQVGDLSEQAANQMTSAEALNQKTEANLTNASEKLAQIDALAPKLSEEMTRFSNLGSDYSQWESRLKSQSMTLKESEQRLKDLTKKLEHGLENVASLRDEMTAFKSEFGGLKKVLAQVLQKFKGLEERADAVHAQGVDVVQAQAEDRARLTALETQVVSLAKQPAMVAPESPIAETALKKIEKQTQFNEKVLNQFEHLSEGYQHLQSVIESILPAPTTIADLTQRVEALESQLGELQSGFSTLGRQGASVKALSETAEDQQGQLKALNDAVQAIQSELLAYASYAEASRATLQQGLQKQHAQSTEKMPAESEKQNGRSAHREAESDHTVLQASAIEVPVTILAKPRSGDTGALKENAVPGGGNAEAEDTALLADVAAAPASSDIGPQDALPVDVGQGSADGSEESELDIISQQLEKLSMESQAWDANFNTEKNQNKGRKKLLFSFLVGTSLLAGSQFLQQSAELEAVPTFANNNIAVQLNHPSHFITGPDDYLASKAPVIVGQPRYDYRYNDLAMALQWPLPDQRAGERVTYGLANNAIYVRGALHQPVVAIAPGEVVFRGLNAGQLGQMVIVQHQNELLSIYGHLEETFVDSGVQVRQGQVLARLGKSQWLEPRLYFEIRYEGLSEDPYLYFAS